MSSYINVIKIAIICFPLIAFFISIPFVLIEYHKFGSISFLKTLIIYSFVLYLMCAYFLVIMPLPKISEVAKLTIPRVQLIPFKFIYDFISNTSLVITNIHTYLKALKESYFYVPVYNIFLTLPFGIYLRYYFKCGFKKTILYTFLLSLFFELTQLSGLYFIYPRGYRLFDVDDLLLNTLGGIVGYLVSFPIIKILPDRDKINLVSLEKGKIISGFRRSTMMILDICLLTILFIIFNSFIHYKYLFYILVIVYYMIIPIFIDGSTIGQRFLNIKVTDYYNKNNYFRLLLRRIVFLLEYFLIPFVCYYIIISIHLDSIFKDFVIIIFGIFIILFYFVNFIKYVFSKKDMFFEKVSKTKLVSTIK